MKYFADLIDEWHDSNSDLPLREFLKLTEEEWNDYFKGNITDEEALALYNARS